MFIRVAPFPCVAWLFNHRVIVVQQRIARCAVALFEGAERVIPAEHGVVLVAVIAQVKFPSLEPRHTAPKQMVGRPAMEIPVEYPSSRFDRLTRPFHA